MIAMACDEIVMSRSATLGDCAPLFSAPTAWNPFPRRAREAGRAVLLDFADSAERNHHDPLLAAAMVAVAAHRLLGPKRPGNGDSSTRTIMPIDHHQPG